jgi:tRNA threonylcarbamoyladenosine biosynthesis protein TsaE
VPVSDTLELISQNVEQTEQMGQNLGELLVAGEVICLSGDLGTGKTAFTRGIGAGWGAVESVTSPTFTLIHEHHRLRDNRVFYHVDCYRLEGVVDAWGIGLEDLLYGRHPVVLEWAENVRDILPPERLWVRFTFLDSTRRHMRISAAGERCQALLDAWRARLTS